MSHSRNEGPEARIVRVGERGAGMMSAGVRDGRIWLNAYTGTGITVTLSLAEAERYALGVLELVRDARAASHRNS